MEPSTDLWSDRSAIKLMIPANRTFKVDTYDASNPTSLLLRGPITIEGEDRHTSQIKLVEASVGSASAGLDDDQAAAAALSGYADLFHAEGTGVIRGITLRNFTVLGSYEGVNPDHGAVRLFSFNNVEDVLFDRMVFTRSRAVIIGGDSVRGITMRGCLLSDSRRGGMVIRGAADVSVEDNDFRWVPDDPIAVNACSPIEQNDAFSMKYGGSIRIVGNRCFGCRGLNVVGAKNVLIADNIHVLGRGRAIHVGTVTDQDKGDTTTLNVIVRKNIILDMMDAEVDPRFDGGTGGHRAIDLELLDGGPGTATPTPNVIPGLPNGNQAVPDPTQYYYTVGQSVGGAPTPHAANLLIEGNIIARTRPPAAPSGYPGHISGFGSFDDYEVGKYGGDAIGYPSNNSPNPILVPLAFLTPTEGIAVSGAARGLTIRGNQIGGCDTCISLKGTDNIATPPFSLFDVVVEQNDLSDWTTADIRFFNYKTMPQRVSIIGNRGNGDAFHRNYRGYVRKNNGLWADTTADIQIPIEPTPPPTQPPSPPAPTTFTAPAGTGSFINAKDMGAIFIAGNHVRNVAQLVYALDDALHAMRDNVGYCDPAGIGYDSGNKGIGNLIAPGKGWHYVYEGSDPTSADSGKILNWCHRFATARPTAGKWVIGTMVQNITSPPTVVTGPPAYIVQGWLRKTTGSGTGSAHWTELRTMVA